MYGLSGGETLTDVLCQINNILQIMILKKLAKIVSRSAARAIIDRQLSESSLSSSPHILVIRWDNKLGDAIVSSFFYREAGKLNAKVTVLTTPELVPLYSQDFCVEHIIETSTHPSFGELRKVAEQLDQVDVVVHLVTPTTERIISDRCPQNS